MRGEPRAVPAPRPCLINVRPYDQDGASGPLPNAPTSEVGRSDRGEVAAAARSHGLGGLQVSKGKRPHRPGPASCCFRGLTLKWSLESEHVLADDLRNVVCVLVTELTF